MNAIDRGFAEHTELRLTSRAAGYASDREVWRALVEQPGLAVISGHNVPSRADAAAEQSASSFSLHGVSREDRSRDVGSAGERASLSIGHTFRTTSG